MRAIFTTINRVDGIYESEIAVRLILVANNDRIIFTAEDDGLNNDNANVLINQSQAKIDQLIGDANYDIGHTFSTGAGGLAGLGVVCRTGQKGRGVTGRAQPVGDAYDVDYVAHEMGHQFGGNHTFNGSRNSCSGANRHAAAAFEPGSGSTIQAYAGICDSDNLQMNSNPYFHCESLDEMIQYTTVGLGNVPPAVPTGNTPPTVNAGIDRVIPKGTPFILTGAGTDADGDRLTYCWEQRDLGPQVPLESPDDGRIPLFRSFEPVTNPERIFPRLATILSNTPSNHEKLPARDRTMNFRVVVRDNRIAGGGIGGDDVQVRVHAAAGPFKVQSPNDAGNFSGALNVRWDVARTDAAPISATHVNIRLSLDGGQTFPHMLAARTPNDGAERVMLPTEPTTTARIKVEAADNIFFDVSDANFTIPSGGRAVVVAAIEDDADAGRLSAELGSVPLDAIFSVGKEAAWTLASAAGKQRGLEAQRHENGAGIVTTLQSSPAHRRVLIVVPRAELGAVTQALGFTADATGHRESDTPSPIELFSGGQSDGAASGPLRAVR